MNDISFKLVIAGMILIEAISPLRASDWLQQGGPNRTGTVPEDVAGKLNTDFKDKKLPLLWQTSVGLGSAPVVVTGGRIYTFGLYKPGVDPATLADALSMPMLDEVNGGKMKLHDVPGTPDWVIKEGNMENYPNDIFQGDEYAQCLDGITGKILWATKISDWGVAYTANTICSDFASPAISDGKIVFHSASGHLYCLNLSDGKMLWEVNLWEHQMYNWGDKKANGCGPLIVNGIVIVSYLSVSDARWKEVLAGKARSEWGPKGGTLQALGGFDLQSGKQQWICKSDIGGFRINDCRIGYAVIENQPTVLVPFGAGTYGVDPATGIKRWEYDIVDDKDDANGRRGLWAPYGSYAPVAWNNYVIDSVWNAHDDIDSRTWCLQIINNKPTLVWETNQLVPCDDCLKSNLLIRDGKVYGFDVHGIWDDPGVPSEKRWLSDPNKPHNEPGRNKRTCGQFQCRDVATGKLLWSADPIKYIDGHGVDAGEYYPTQSIISGDILIAWSKAGLGILKLRDDGVDLLANGPPDYYFLWKGWGNGSEPVLVDGLLYVRKLISSTDGTTNEGNLFCYDLRAK